MKEEGIIDMCMCEKPMCMCNDNYLYVYICMWRFYSSCVCIIMWHGSVANITMPMCMCGRSNVLYVYGNSMCVNNYCVMCMCSKQPILLIVENIQYSEKLWQ